MKIGPMGWRRNKRNIKPPKIRNMKATEWGEDLWEGEGFGWQKKRQRSEMREIELCDKTRKGSFATQKILAGPRPKTDAP